MAVSAPAGVKGFATKRIGPLPVWGWTVIGAGAIGLLLYVRRRNAAAAGGAGTVGPDVAGVTQTPGGAPPDAGGPTNGGGNTVPPTSQSSPPATNPGPATPTNELAYGFGTPDWNPPAGIPATQTALTDFLRGGAAITTADRTTAVINSIEGSINDAARIVGGTSSLVGVSISPTGNAQTDEAARQAIASGLNARGYTAASYGGQVYAAQTSQEFFAGLPPQAQANLARLLVALGAH